MNTAAAAHDAAGLAISTQQHRKKSNTDVLLQHTPTARAAAAKQKEMLTDLAEKLGSNPQLKVALASAAELGVDLAKNLGSPLPTPVNDMLKLDLSKLTPGGSM